MEDSLSGLGIFLHAKSLDSDTDLHLGLVFLAASNGTPWSAWRVL